MSDIWVHKSIHDIYKGIKRQIKRREKQKAIPSLYLKFNKSMKSTIDIGEFSI